MKIPTFFQNMGADPPLFSNPRINTAQIILDAKLMTPSVDMFKQLYWLPFDKRVHYLRCVVIYKARNCMTPNYITGKFTQEYGENPTHYLRPTSKVNFKLGKPQTNARKQSWTIFLGNCLEYSTSQHQNFRYLEHIQR